MTAYTRYPRRPPVRRTLSGPRSPAGHGRMLWLLLPAVLLAALVTVFLVSQLNAPPALDKLSGCPTDRPLTDSAVVMIDATDGFSAGEVRRLENYVSRWLAEAPRYGKFTLLLIDAEQPDDPREVISRCSPGTGEDLNPAFNTREEYERAWRNTFVKPIRDSLAGLRDMPASPTSPIMQSIAAATWRPDFDGSVPRRRLYMVSDMLQHIPGGYSHYSGGDLSRAWERSGLADTLLLDLRQVDVRVLYMHRSKTADLQRREHRIFWRDWLRDAGAVNVAVDGLQPQGAPAKGGRR